MDERAADETVPLELDALVDIAAAAEVIDAAAEEEAALIETVLEAEAEVEAVVAAAVEPPVTEN